MTKSTITDKRVTSVIERLEHYACNLKWTNVRGAQDLLTAADGLRELQERRKAAMDSEPVAWQYRVSAGPATGWSLWHDGKGEQYENSYKVERRPLYTHDQSAPVVPDDYQHLRELYHTLEKRLFKIAQRIKGASFDKYSHSPSQAIDVLEVAIFGEDEACRAAMHQVGNSPAQSDCCPAQSGNSPAIPDGYVIVPLRLTAENGAKGALSGEFSETKFVNCPECFGDEECETCDGSGKIEITVPVTWTTIKAIWVKGVEHFAATAQEND